MPDMLWNEVFLWVSAWLLGDGLKRCHKSVLFFGALY